MILQFQKLLSFVSIVFIFSAVVSAQQNRKSNVTQLAPASANQAIKSSPAYAEVLLRKTELASEVEGFLESYTENFPKVKVSRYELDLIQKDLDTILAQTDAAKLTLALGKLLVKRATLNADLWDLQSRYGAEHPEVKRAKRKVLNFDNAVKEIMP